MKFKTFSTIAMAVMISATGAIAAPVTFDGMGMQKQWVDNEDVRDEMPGFVWGDSDTQGADKIGLYVEFADGTTGGISYTGVSGHWNTNGAEFGTISMAFGFFADYATAGLHFLYNTAPTNIYPEALPIAWIRNPTTPFGSNVELDYNDSSSGSEFRISASGWDFVTITTYSSSADAPQIPLPATGLMLLCAIGGLGLARKRNS